jgi:FixJ family two-component response regulator
LLSREDERPASGTVTNRWVAIIDDHDSIRSALALSFRIEGIHAETFASAEEYLAHSEATPPFCLVLDLQLPGMTGHELAHFLERGRPPLPPTVFISGHDDLLASLKGSREALGWLRKPFETDALMALVKPLVSFGTG